MIFKDISALRLLLSSLCASIILNLVVLTQPAYCNPTLPGPGGLITKSPGYSPARIRALRSSPEHGLQFDFIIDAGDSGLKSQALSRETLKLVRYFMAALTVPPADLWVNLSPYEAEKIIPEALGRTELGRDLLSQDYLLKQLSSSITFPEDRLGKDFWERIYQKAYEMYQTTDIPVNTFNKVWIVPDKAVVYEQDGMAIVAEARLKVMIEQDYLAMIKNIKNPELGSDQMKNEEVKTIDDFSSKIVRELLIPEIEKEVNEGMNFAPLRQIYHSMILAVWYKNTVKESILGKVYADRNKIAGIDTVESDSKEKIYQQYLEAFKKGAYNFIREDLDPQTRQMIPRKYYSGGFSVIGADGIGIQDRVGTGVNEFGDLSQTGQQNVNDLREGLEAASPALTAYTVEMAENAQGTAERSQETGSIMADISFVPGVTEGQRQEAARLSVREASGETRELTRIAGKAGLDIFSGLGPGEVLQVRESVGGYELSETAVQTAGFLARIGVAPAIKEEGVISVANREDHRRFQLFSVERIDGQTLQQLADAQGGLNARQQRMIAAMITTLIANRVYQGRLFDLDGEIRSVKIGRKVSDPSAFESALVDDHGLGNASIFEGTVQELAQEYLNQIDEVKLSFEADPQRLQKWNERYGFLERFLLQLREKGVLQSMLDDFFQVGPEVDGFASHQRKPGDENLAKMLTATGGRPIPHRADSSSFQENLFSVNQAVEMAILQGKAASLTEDERRGFLEYLQTPQVAGKIADSGVELRTLMQMIEGDQARILLVADVRRRSPVLVVRGRETFQAGHVGLTRNAIYVGQGIARELLDSSVEEDRGLFYAFLAREVVALAKAREIYNGNNYDESVRQAEDVAERFEKSLVAGRLDDRLKRSVGQFFDQQRPVVVTGARYSLERILGYNVSLGPAAKDVMTIHQEFLSRVLRMDGLLQRQMLERYKGFLDVNRATMEIFYSPEEWQAIERISAALQDGYYKGNFSTSYPARELFAVRYIEEFMPELLQRAAADLEAQVPALTSDLSHEQLFTALNDAAKGVVNAVNVSPDVEFQVINELVTRFYTVLLRRDSTEARKVRLSETTSRDGQQSNIGTNLTGEQQRQILDLTFEYGVIDRYETWGGATTQSAVLDNKRNGNPPEDPFYNARQQKQLLQNKLIAAFGAEFTRLSQADRDAVLNRFRTDVARRFLTSQQLEEILTRNQLSDDIKENVRRLYAIRQEMLLRGQYIVGLMPYPDTVLRKFIETAYKNGVDIFRIFDAFNDPRKIERAIVMARDIGALVQPVIHYTTDFPTGIDGYVRLAQRLIAAAGDAIDSLVIKDAGGLLEPSQAYRLVKGLRDAGVTVPIQVHTHDVAGNRQLTLLEAIRANGGRETITVDVATGELAAPFAQPNLRHFLGIIKDSSWESGLVDPFNFERMQMTEQLIKDSILPVLPIAPITTRQRQGVLSGRLPGGMKTNNDADLRRAIMGDPANRLPSYARAINAALGITVLDAQNRLTAEGLKFKDAFDALLYEEMRRVTADMGGISLVTPTSEWIGKQAFNNAMAWIIKGHIDLDRSKAEWVLNPKSSLSAMSRKAQYRLGLANLHEGLQNYLIERSQDKDVLGAMYPSANAEIVLLAFELEGLNDAAVDAQGFLTNNVLGPLASLKTALEKDFVDRPTIRLMKEIEKIAQSQQETPDQQKAKSALETSQFTRDVVLLGMRTLPQDVNIAKTWEEYQQDLDRQRRNNPEINSSDEDLLLFALFPKRNQYFNLVAWRQKARKEALSSGLTREQILALGMSEDDARELAPDPAQSQESVSGEFTTDQLGGINLNPALFDLQIKRDPRGMPLPVMDQGMDQLKINGFYPVIIDVKPASRLILTDYPDFKRKIDKLGKL